MNKSNTTTLTALMLLLTAAPALQGAQADRFANVEVTSRAVSGSVHMLMGAGGNIGISVGADGTLMIDDQFGPLAQRIQSAIDELGGAQPKLVLNTHFHGDHTGSNAHFGTAGTIIAHENVRIRLVNAENVDRVALPVVTYQDRIRLFFNDDEIEVVHLPAGHTDGDSVVWFKNANVIHLGDHFFNGRFPYIDLQSGGSVGGFVKNLETVVDMVPDDIQIIPGHGELGTVNQVSQAIEMIHATKRHVQAQLDAGKSKDAIIAGGVDERWTSYGGGFINEEGWIQILLADAASR